MLVVFKAILYEGAVALRARVNFRKDLKGSKPGGTPVIPALMLDRSHQFPHESGCRWKKDVIS